MGLGIERPERRTCHEHKRPGAPMWSGWDGPGGRLGAIPSDGGIANAAQTSSAYVNATNLSPLPPGHPGAPEVTGL
jgi:hypothetical protein